MQKFEKFNFHPKGPFYFQWPIYIMDVQIRPVFIDSVTYLTIYV